MKKLVLIGVFFLAACNEEVRQGELSNINKHLPMGCVVADVGDYANIEHVLVVVCEGAKTISTNTSWTKRVGKIVKNRAVLPSKLRSIKVQKLSYDVSRCCVTDENKDCSLASGCLRRLDEGREKYQSFTAFKGGVDCDGFIGSGEVK
jgi:hypothetical protein